MLRIRDLQVDKRGQTICQVAALDVERGECVGIVGPNGCGKSTLLRVISGIEREVDGECDVQLPLRKRVYVHQSPYLFRGSVAENVGFPLAVRQVAKQLRKSQVAHWLDVFNVAHLAERPCSRLSGGERRRVALARAFTVRADLLLLDEPLAELDEDGIEIVSRAIANEAETTILFASPVPVDQSLAQRSVCLG